MRVVLFSLFAATLCNAQAIVANPSSLTKAFVTNSTTPATDSITVTAIGAITAATVTQSGGNWLSVAPASGGTTTTLSVTTDPSGLPDGTYLAAVNIKQSTATQAVPIVMTVGNPGPQLPSAGVVNAASYQGGAVSPGEIVALFGTNIGPQIPYGAKIQDGAFLAKLAATRVLFDNIPAPLIYGYPNQLAAVVPFEVAGKSSVHVQVENLVARTPPVVIAVQESIPALFTADSSGTGLLAALNEDGSLNTISNPAGRGSIVVLYGTGAGAMDAAIPNGVLVDAPYPNPILPVRVTIGGQSTELLYHGAAPGEIAGMIQLNVRVPSGITAGNAPVILFVGAAQSQPGVTIGVK